MLNGLPADLFEKGDRGDREISKHKYREGEYEKYLFPISAAYLMPFGDRGDHSYREHNAISKREIARKASENRCEIKSR